MRLLCFLIIVFLLSLSLNAQHHIFNISFKPIEIEKNIFKHDRYWRGADGAATVALSNNKILWLFSDTFIDQDGTGKRSNSNHMIRNSIGIQNSNSITSEIKFYWKGTKKHPKDFFQLPGSNWFWTGHGIYTKDKLMVFLIEETSQTNDPGFKAIGWYLAIINNPNDDPEFWDIKYVKGCDTFGVIVGSSAILEDADYVYCFGVKEPNIHSTYLIRFNKEELTNGDLTSLAWWVDNDWDNEVTEEPISSSLFNGATEFSVHYDYKINQFIQIQTFGFGNAQLGYRLADKLHGPWTEPVMFYSPKLENSNEFCYTANAHPEFSFNNHELIVTYNVNNIDSNQLRSNEDIYFPKIIKLIITK